MKVKVTKIETIAFDDQQVHCTGDNVDIVIRLRGNHNSLRVGQELSISTKKTKKS